MPSACSVGSQPENGRRARAASPGSVITSYSIHYTKLYEYPLLTVRFAHAMAGRVTTAANLMLFAGSFLAQWGIGSVLRLYPVADGRYSPEGYAAAFIGLGVLQLTSVLWLLPMRQRFV